MKLGKQILYLIAVLIPLSILALNLVDIINLYQHSDSYPFNSEFFSSFSVYRSRNTYLIYIIGLSILTILMIIYAVKKKWKVYGILFIITAILFLYPLFTTD